ncbi:MAG: hypothetical protein DLM50_07480 [Candidatus Meridianibacter frigidus]|nr:MAG: hypothetical protein DLM50_07480 [Candidatus Eremiobacteraeota bacterium]
MELAALLRAKQSFVLVLGTGSDRNLPVLRSSAANVEVVDEGGNPLELPGASVDAVLSTHGLLHGRCSEIAARLDELRRVARKNAFLYATFGSVRDSRFGEGIKVETNVFAPKAGDEAGVPHAFFDRIGLQRLLKGFVISNALEIQVDDIAGAWAHRQTALRGAVHWFVKARRR